MDRPIFFCHIPKTGGTSVRVSLASHFAPGQMMPGPGMMKSAGGHYPRISIVAREMNVRAANIRFMCGHYHFSAHHFLEDCTKIVVLREPAAQVISHMRHFIAAGQFTVEHCLNLLDQGKCPVQNNVMTRYLGGSLLPLRAGSLDEKHKRLMHGSIDSLRVDDALENLDKADIVGFTDQMAAFIQAVEKAIKIPVVEHRTNTATAELLELSPNQMEVVLELNRFDVELYERAKKLRC